MEIMNQMEGVNLREKKGGRFKFRLHLTPAMSDVSIEALDLSPRAYNSLKRAGYDSIGVLVDAIADGNSLMKIRNCGAKSVREIMEHLFVYQYNSLPTEKREAYLCETVMINKR